MPSGGRCLEREREMEEVAVAEKVCVTGAGGYVASWLVKFLLSKGYMVHGTVRDPSNVKNAHLEKLEKATKNLKIFKADLLNYSALSVAIAGCHGVFHVASPVPFLSNNVPNSEVELITPAVTGTLNVLKACSAAKVRRVVVVTSEAAVAVNPNWPRDRVKDEECWSDKEYCRINEWWYSLSKTLAESEALDYAKKHGLDVVTVCPSMVIGPLLQSTVNASSFFLINLMKEDREPIEHRIWHFVDVRDVADAILLVYENPEAYGRYICSPHRISIRDMVDMLKSMFPNYDYPENIKVEEGSRLSSEKLKSLGWKCRTLKESIIDSVECYQAAGLLRKN